jgi:predicted protein tyrosine phosphatase
MKHKPKILCICARGMNRSKYLAKYLRRKGYSTTAGGVEPFENPEYKWNPVSQKKIDWADYIIIVRKRLIPILKKNYNTKGKEIISLDVTDSKRLIPEEFKELRDLDHKVFNKKWTYPNLRKAIKPYLSLK